MTPADARIEEIFQEAMDLAPSERRAHLATRFAGDAALLRAVEDLLDAAERPGGWNEPAMVHEARATADSAVPGSLDRYRLEERIGAGGMGVVYRAARVGEFSKRVAIKIVHHGLHDQAQARFSAERQILAGLDHPNIARLLDGGATSDGLPFLVMEYIDGVTVDRYLADRRPSQREALELFRKICAAVASAHRSLVVHRDLKPGNIVVTSDGEPKLLDFGVAKLLDGSGDRTQTGMAAMTPQYASPEQIRGAAVTTATDVYSLGVLLYEFLSGRRPYSAASGALDLARAITTEEPPPLSGVDEDLATIVAMAMRKEPERRYASVDQFSEDIRRFLDGYPVAARPDTRTYRARMFARRNRGPIAAAAVLLLAVMGGAAATYRQARIADRRFAEVRRLAHSYLFEVQDALQSVPGATAARQLVVKRAFEYLDRLAQEKTNDPRLIEELAEAYFRLAAVQGRPDAPSLGDRAGALANYRKSLSYREQLYARAPGNVPLGLALADTHAIIGKLHAISGDIKSAEASDRKAVAIDERLVALRPTDGKVRDMLATHMANLGDVLGNPNLPNLGQTKAALELYRRSLAIHEEVAASDPTNREARRMAALRSYQIAQMEQALNNGPGAVEAYKKGIALNEALAEGEPANTLILSSLARTNRALAIVYVQLLRDAAAARPYSERGLAIFEQLAKADPADIDAQISLADGYYGHGFVLRNAADPRGALAQFDRAITIYDRVSRERATLDPALARTAYQLRADALFDLGEYAKSLDSSQKVLRINERLLQIDPNNASAQRNQGIAFSQIAKVHRRHGRWREARAWYQKELDVLEAQQKKGTLIPMYVRRLDAARQAVDECDAKLAGKS